MQQTVMSWLGVLTRIAIPLLVLSLGMTSAQVRPAYFWRRRGLLLRALLAIDVLVPVAALLLVLVLPLPRAIEIGLVLLAIAPGAPFAPMKSLKLGSDPVFTYTLQIILALLTIVTLPVSLALLARAFGFPWHVEIAAVSKTVLLGQIVPLALGLGLRRFLPTIAARLGPSLAVLTNLMLLLLFGLFMVTHGASILELGAASLLGLLAMASIALLIGHLLGGPELATRRAVAVDSALRHPGLALLVAHVNFPSLELMPVIIAYVIAAALAALAYQHLTLRSQPVAHERGAE